MILRSLKQQRRFKATSPTTMVSISIQTESEQNPLMNEFVKLEKEFENSKREHETTLSYIRELGFENHNLRKQNSRIVEEKEILNEEKKILEGTIKELKMINTDLTDESELIIVCKVEKEGKIKQLEEENEKLVTQYTILSNQRKELEASLTMKDSPLSSYTVC